MLASLLSHATFTFRRLSFSLNLILLDLCSLWGVALPFYANNLFSFYHRRLVTVTVTVVVAVAVAVNLPYFFMRWLCVCLCCHFLCRILCYLCCRGCRGCHSNKFFFSLAAFYLLWWRLLLHFVASAGFWSLHKLASAFIIMNFFLCSQRLYFILFNFSTYFWLLFLLLSLRFPHPKMRFNHLPNA